MTLPQLIALHERLTLDWSNAICAEGRTPEGEAWLSDYAIYDAGRHAVGAEVLNLALAKRYRLAAFDDVDDGDSLQPLRGERGYRNIERIYVGRRSERRGAE